MIVAIVYSFVILSADEVYGNILIKFILKLSNACDGCIQLYISYFKKNLVAECSSVIN
jgi:hypothetical protein